LLADLVGGPNRSLGAEADRAEADRAEDRPETDRARLVLAVAHSTTNRILLAIALHIPVRDYRRRFRQEPANLTVLRFWASAEHGAELLLANDVSHVRGIRGATWE
jgi:broad specificity phosphatase PhoE